MLVDLHAHYPMHVIPAEQRRVPLHRWRRARLRALLVDLISRAANYQGPGGEPSVTAERLTEGDVGVALSVLYGPFDEIDFDCEYGAPPRPGYIDTVLDQIDAVEAEAATQTGVRVVRNRRELDAARAAGEVALVHCVEGGFALGATAQQVRDNVARLAQRGVAYITLAHLFWRQVATNAPALPFLPDRLYKRLFPQPAQTGLGALGRAAVAAMADNRVLVDVTHMNEQALHETLVALDPSVPVLASHGAMRFGSLEYSFDDDAVRRIAAHGGVIGLISCTHYIADGLDKPKTFDDSVALLCRHIDRIHDITGSFDHVAIGSDLDGYIKPALPGLEHAGRMRDLQGRLRARYGPADAQKITGDNALRILQYALS